MAGYDAIVLGLGGVGSAAAAHLAEQGARVLGLEQFTPAHDRGSSHGHTRMIRQAYCEHPDYVPLLRIAYQQWRDLEHRTAEKLFYEVGLLNVGRPDGMVVRGVLQAAQEHGLPLDKIEPQELGTRFPGFLPQEDSEIVFEQQAGFLMVEKCVHAHLHEASRRGADLRYGETARRCLYENDSVVVETNAGTYHAKRLIIAAGAWANHFLGDLLAELGIHLRIRRKHLFWFANQDSRYTLAQGCPGFMYDAPDGIYYGFPQLDPRGVKAARHSGGEEINNPSNLDRSLDRRESADVARFLNLRLPGIRSEQTDHTVCMYTMSPDEHFIVDRHPDRPQVSFAAGLSGHGFKFTGVLGKALAELALEGTSSLPIGFLNCRRESLRCSN